jgi:hypothetical protein
MQSVITAGHKKTPADTGKGPELLAQSSQITPSTGASIHGAPFPKFQLAPIPSPEVQAVLQEHRALFATAALAAAVRAVAHHRNIAPARLLGDWVAEDR